MSNIVRASFASGEGRWNEASGGANSLSPTWKPSVYFTLTYTHTLVAHTTQYLNKDLDGHVSSRCSPAVFSATLRIAGVFCISFRFDSL